MNIKTIYQKFTSNYSAEINTLDPKLNKYARYEAKFVTAKGVTPRCFMACGWQTIEAAHKMIDWQAAKYNK